MGKVILVNGNDWVIFLWVLGLVPLNLMLPLAVCNNCFQFSVSLLYVESIWIVFTASCSDCQVASSMSLTCDRPTCWMYCSCPWHWLGDCLILEHVVSHFNSMGLSYKTVVFNLWSPDLWGGVVHRLLKISEGVCHSHLKFLRSLQMKRGWKALL